MEMEPSKLALEAINALKATLPVFYDQCYPLIDPIVRFLIDEFDFNIDPNPISWFAGSDLKRHTKLYNAIIFGLMQGLKSSDTCSFDFDEDWDHVIFCHVLTWYLNDEAAVVVRHTKNQHTKRRDVEEFDDGLPHTPQQTSHHFELTALDYPPPGLAQKPVPFPSGSFYGELSTSRETFLRLKQTAARDLERQQHQKSKSDEDCSDKAQDNCSKARIATSCNIAEFPELKGNVKYLKKALQSAKQSRQPLPLEPLRTPALENIPVQEVLIEIVQKAGTEYQSRYGSLIDALESEINDVLLHSLTPGMKNTLQLGSISLDELKSIAGEPEKGPGPGVYLHIIAERPKLLVDSDHSESSEEPERTPRFWLYVGQAFNLQILKHPSLHYYVWDSVENAESVFVKLAGFDTLNDHRLPLLLNLEEMFMACVLQTLRPSDLDRWLPDHVAKPWAGMHLDVALPLWQGFSEAANLGECVTRQTFSDALFNSDPLVKKWAEDLRNGFHTLRFSSDYRLRGYWHQVITADLVATGAAARQAEKFAYQEFLAKGAHCTVWISGWGHSSMAFGEFRFHMSAKSLLRAGLENGDKIFIRPFLLNIPVHYAMFAMPAGPNLAVA